MKKIFTLFASVAIACNLASAQEVTITWPLTTDGVLTPVVTGAGAEFITASDVTVGSNITITEKVKSYSYEGGKGTMFCDGRASRTELKKADGTGAFFVNFPINVAAGYEFAPASISFFGAKDGTGNNYRANIFFRSGDSDLTVKDYTFVRGSDSKNPDVQGDFPVLEVPAGTNLSGATTLIFDLWGKTASNTKGWVIGNLVIKGNLVSTGDTRIAAPLSWSAASTTLKVRDAFTAPVLSNEKNLAVTYTSNNPDLVAVDSQTGAMTLTPATMGTATITATFAGDTEYLPASLSTTISVVTNVKEENAVLNYDPVLNVKTDAIYNPADHATGLTDPTELLADDNITITSVHPAKVVTTYAKSYCGRDFTHTLQLRVEAAPTVDNPTGTQRADCTPLVVVPNKDLTLLIFGRRQTVKGSQFDENDDVENNIITRTNYMEANANDGKAIYVSDQTDPATKLPQESLYGDKFDSDYVATCTAVPLQAGKTYTVWTRGTTYHAHGIGYSLDADVTGINTINADTNAPVEYFNLQGVRVDNPAQGGLYIRRQGTTVSKVVIR